MFGLWFALVVYNKIPTPFGPKMRSIQKGLLFAVVQTIISTGFLFPYVYARKLGFAIFSFGDNLLGTNHDHWKLPFASCSGTSSGGRSSGISTTRRTRTKPSASQQSVHAFGPGLHMRTRPARVRDPLAGMMSR